MPNRPKLLEKSSEFSIPFCKEPVNMLLEMGSLGLERA